MPPISTEEHAQFLQSCLKHAKEINWDGVAKDIGITKNAAGKRYKRFMEAQTKGESGDGVGVDPSTPAGKKRGGGRAGVGPSTGKKRKTQAKSTDEVEDDVDEGLSADAVNDEGDAEDANGEENVDGS